ncbi:MAG: 30S ribosome-binding factor RbfA [Deltaproteobacteria bacterium]|nr:30S ribosome-binding factor RbfA [Deltaproteobacteria bacterium]MBI3390026.1 30S ribosome-binding factor RbfA [Deltaproteobacteria bacterium]
MSGHRAERVSDALRAVIAELLAREIKDPRVGMVTLTAVEMTPDLKHARVFFSCLGDDAAHERTLAGLRSARGFIKAQATRQLGLRFAPDITFVFDPSLERAERLAVLLREDDQAHQVNDARVGEPPTDVDAPLAIKPRD